MEGHEIFGTVLIIIGIGYLLYASFGIPNTTETDMAKGKGKKGCCGGTKK